jgi:hypothetical protein
MFVRLHESYLKLSCRFKSNLVSAVHIRSCWSKFVWFVSIQYKTCFYMKLKSTFIDFLKEHISYKKFVRGVTYRSHEVVPLSFETSFSIVNA